MRPSSRGMSGSESRGLRPEYADRPDYLPLCGSTPCSATKCARCCAARYSAIADVQMLVESAGAWVVPLPTGAVASGVVVVVDVVDPVRTIDGEAPPPLGPPLPPTTPCWSMTVSKTL